MAGAGLKALGMLIRWYWWRKPVPFRQRLAPIKAFWRATAKSKRPVWLREKPSDDTSPFPAYVTHYPDFHDIRITLAADLSH